ncbi:glycerol kinase [Sphingomonas parva]|uniref:Glycerol kinase n=1 Tax=Sphingomonas parva TaxID=2555898 RepID=A0A4Y8ZQR7_9SPHN|nr:glycerol kinase [Sphingomonas parva]TFI57807.1 glycerol kinase [Sphingomonas parva]
MGDDLLVIDEGTTSSRAMLFGVDGRCRGTAQRDLTQHHPAPGLVEHDAEEIWRASLACAREVLRGADGRVAALGISNQRETIVFWSRTSGRALAPAIVWQDRRTADLCEALREQGREPLVQARTGLLLDPYFSASKIAWALAHWPQLRAAGDDLCIGTVESWLVFRLTGGLHVSDATNASRTALMDIHRGGWDEELLDLWGVPRRALPEIVDCAGSLGTTLPEHLGTPIPIAGLAGDQQAAAIGQACLAPGDSKATFGTGAFILTHTGGEAPLSRHRLLTTIAWQLGGVRRYALEGSVFVAGSLVQWLRDSLGLLSCASESESLARSVPDNGGVYLVPALSGLGAPYWQPSARAALSGLSFSSGRAHVARAALEAMAHQAHDLMTAFAGDGAAWQCLKIDGGMVANDWIAQDLADMLALPVERPLFVETTALGAAMLAGVGCGLFASLDEAAAMRGAVEGFAPAMAAEVRDARLAGWADAVKRVLG